MKKRIFKMLCSKALAFITGAALMVQAYVPTIANAAEETKYIREVYLSYGEDDAAKIEAYFKEHKDKSKADRSMAGILYKILSETKYEEGTLTLSCVGSAAVGAAIAFVIFRKKKDDDTAA